MTRGVVALKDEVVDLLVTWGATGIEGAATLFQLLSEFGEPRDAAPTRLLRLALETPEACPDDGLRDELADIDRALASAGQPVPRKLADRLEQALQRLSQKLGSRISEQREQLTAELAPWWLLMTSEERSDALSNLWLTAPGQDLVARFSALARLRRLREIADGVRQGRREEIRELLDSGEGDLDPEVATEARRAVESDDPASLAEVGRSLRTLTGGRARRRAERKIAEIRPRVVDLVERGRRALSSGDVALSPPARKILEASLDRAGTALERGLSLESWEESLGAMLEGLADSTGLVDAAAVEPLLADLADRRGREEGESELAEKLRETARGLESALVELASLLPTDRVFEARLLLERVDETAASGESERVEELCGSIGRTTTELNAQAGELREERRDRGEARRKRLLEQAARLERLSTGRATSRVQSLIGELEAARPEDLEKLRDSVEDLARPVENEVRLGGARVLAKAKTTGGGEIEQLRKALDDDDLPTVAELTASLSGSGGIGALLRGPLAWFAIPLLAGVLSFGFVLGRSWWSNRPKEYHLSLSESAPASRSFEIKLVGPDQPRVQDCDPVGGATFSLPPGHYEVYVNDRYTGRELRVPDDPTEVVDIPIPPEVAGN
jgi:hypothetical protein